MTNENGKTKYYVLMEELKQSILSGEIKPGEKLPSENELSARLSDQPPYGAQGPVEFS